MNTVPVYLRNMNPEQTAAIAHQDGPAALLAQAGSGKTRALVHRIARMVAEGTPERLILAVTFSKKAADEMNERLDQLGIEEARVGTWHSLCLEILKDDPTPQQDWEIDDKNRAQFVLKDVLGYKGLDWKDSDPNAVARYIGHCKANLIDPGTEEAFKEAANHFGNEQEQRLAADAFEMYQGRIGELGMLTFDDFLVYAVKWLEQPENRAKWAARWRYLLVDECQDNNRAQKVLQKLLAGFHRNIMVVGDLAQAIYSFRGSTPKFLAEFAEEWGAVSIYMNRNYRSGRRIVDVANKIIAPAAVRLPTEMIAERDADGSVTAMAHPNQDAEGEAFAAWVEELHQNGEGYGSITALFRTNAQSRALEEALLKRRIPYVVVGGTSFYERKEVKDLLAYLRVATGRDKEGDAVKRCINAPFRYLGKAFVERVEEARGANWVAKVRAAAQSAGIQRRQQSSAEEWARLVEWVAGEVGKEKPEPPAAILAELVHRTGYIQWLEKDNGEESIETSHAANVREMVRIAEQFGTVGALLDYIEEMAKAARKQRQDKQSGGERVLLMSIHRSKGLEWPNVWVNGCNEMVLPHARGDIEEERRLMYVAATRARDRLVLSYVRSFATRDGVKDAQPSRFLHDAGLVASDGAGDAEALAIEAQQV